MISKGKYINTFLLCHHLIDLKKYFPNIPLYFQLFWSQKSINNNYFSYACMFVRMQDFCARILCQWQHSHTIYSWIAIFFSSFCPMILCPTRNFKYRTQQGIILISMEPILCNFSYWHLLYSLSFFLLINLSICLSLCLSLSLYIYIYSTEFLDSLAILLSITPSRSPWLHPVSIQS